MQRAIRRHHRKRIIQKWRRIVDHWYMGRIDKDEWARYMYGKGSIRCGCGLCISPRRGGYGDSPLTIQERKAEENANDQLNKNYEYINGCVLDSAYWDYEGCDCGCTGLNQW
jgi:hypothetical protein